MLKNLSIPLWLLLMLLVTLQNCASSDLADPPKGYRSDATMKMAYAIGGGIVGGFAYALTGGDLETAQDV